MTESDRPLDALNAARNQRVIVELKNKTQLVGKLKAFDIHINTVLEEAEERENGEIKRKLGTVFLRGDMILMISPGITSLTDITSRVAKAQVSEANAYPFFSLAKERGLNPFWSRNA